MFFNKKIIIKKNIRSSAFIDMYSANGNEEKLCFQLST